MFFLGTPRITVDETPIHFDTRKAIALLAFLGAQGGRCTRDSLVTLLWSRYGPAGGHSALRRTLCAVRKELAHDWLAVDGEFIGLRDSEDVRIDIARCSELLQRCEGHPHGKLGACPRCLPLLEEAAQLCRGDFLCGFTLRDSPAFDDWQFVITDACRRQAARILERLAICHSATGKYEQALDDARKLVDLDPLDEGSHRMLMKLHGWSGNRSAALLQFEECSRLLRGELNVQPQTATRCLRDEIAADRLPEPPVFPPTAGERGLAAALQPRQRLARESAGAVLIAMRKSGRPVKGSLRAELRRIVSSYGGRVQRHGGHLRGWFGLGDCQECGPELGVRAALALRETADSLGVVLGSGIAAGAGSSAARRALRLAEVSGSGAILADELTHRLTRGAFCFASTEQKVAGKLCYRALNLWPDSRKERGTEGFRAPMVGRVEEARRLELAWKEAAGGHGRVVVVTGEAGIGKSRLVQAFRDRCVHKTWWLEGRCLSASVKIGYWPFVDLLRSLFAGPSDITRKTQDLLDNRRPGATALGEIADVISDLLAAGAQKPRDEKSLTPQQAKQRTFRCLLSFFAGLAESDPLVMVFEDLQWADSLSLELIDALMEALADRPSLLLLVHRNDPARRSHYLASSAARRRPGRLVEIHLREMSPAQCEELLEYILPHGPLIPEARERILDLSQGNPYFLEELSRAFQEAPASRRQVPGFEPAASGSADATVPEGIKMIILSRFNTLPPLAREVLGQASAFGRVFRDDFLRLAVDSPDLPLALDCLQDRELLFVERTLPEVQYSFKHVLAQEALYESLSEGRKVEVHRRCAEAMETACRGEEEQYCEELARHCDRGKLLQKAIGYYYQAGEKARSAYANEAAVSLFSRGLKLLRQSPAPRDEARELEFRITMGPPLIATRGIHSSAAGAHYARARRICSRVGDEHQQSQVMYGLQDFLRGRGRNRKCKEVGEEALGLALRANDPVLISRAHYMLGGWLRFMGDFEGSLAHCESALAHYHPGQRMLDYLHFSVDTGVNSLFEKALAQWQLGFPDRAAANACEALDQAAGVSHPMTRARILYHAATLACWRGETPMAAEYSRELVELSRKESLPIFAGVGSMVQGWAVAVLGRPRDGIEMIECARQMISPMPFGTFWPNLRADAYARLGELDRAAAAIEESISEIPRTDLHLWEPELHRVRGELGLLRGESQASAEERFLEALRIAGCQRARILELRAAMSMHRLKKEQGRGDESLRLLQAVYERFVEGFDTGELTAARELIAAGA